MYNMDVAIHSTDCYSLYSSSCQADLKVCYFINTTMSSESKDPEVKDMLEEKPSEETIKDSTIEPTEAPIETTKEPDLSAIYKHLENNAKIMEDMMKNYETLIGTLKDDLVQTKSELAEFKEETKKKEPMQVEAMVKGKYDFTKVVQKMGHKSLEDYKEHCRKIYDRFNSEYATINNIRNA